MISLLISNKREHFNGDEEEEDEEEEREVQETEDENDSREFDIRNQFNEDNNISQSDSNDKD